MRRTTFPQSALVLGRRNIMNSTTLRFSLATTGSFLVFALTAMAQTAPNAPDLSQDEPVVISQVVVTGSYLPDRPNTATKPVQVIEAQQLADAGVATDLADFMRKAVPGFTRSEEHTSELQSLRQLVCR